MSETPDPYAARPYVPPAESSELPEAPATGTGSFTHRFEDQASPQADASSAAPVEAGSVPTASTYASQTSDTQTLPPVPPASTWPSEPLRPPRRPSSVATGLLAAALIGGAAGVGGAAAYEKFVAPSV